MTEGSGSTVATSRSPPLINISSACDFYAIDDPIHIEYSPQMTEMEINDRWESLCLQCGLCCFENIEDDTGAIFFTGTPCRYLDVVTRCCKVYERRFEINPDCIKLTPELVRELNWLHDDCGYRRAMELTRRPGRRTNPTDKEQDED